MPARKRVYTEDGKFIDLVGTNALNHGCPPEIIEKYLEARAILKGTGFSIGEKFYAREAPWAKPKCPNGCTSFVNCIDHGVMGGPHTWQCWGCGAHLVSTEREKDWTPPDMPDWVKSQR